jgi:chemotaxis signal transduction protein
VIIIGGEPTMTGLLVDGSEQVIQIDAENIQKPGESDVLRKPFIDGFVALSDRLIALLNVDRILSFTSLKSSSDQTQGALS